MEGEKKELTSAEKKAAIAEIDRRLAELEESPDIPEKQKNLVSVKNGKCVPVKEFKPIRAVTAEELDMRVPVWCTIICSIIVAVAFLCNFIVSKKLREM